MNKIKFKKVILGLGFRVHYQSSNTNSQTNKQKECERNELGVECKVVGFE
jgi:hypothetical protein